MHDDDIRRCEQTPEQLDHMFRRTILDEVLDLHPTHLRAGELVLAITAGADESFEGSDAIERAIRDLTGAGLLHCPGGIVMPTNAALCFAELSEDRAD